jgi:plastocyanin
VLALLFGALNTSALAAGRGVAIRDTSFSPATITIKVGDRITWTNRGSVPHNVTFDSFASTTYMDPGTTFAHTFKTAGTFVYQCTLHSFAGKVVVTTAATPKPTPVPTPKKTPKPTAKPTATPEASETPSVTPASALPGASSTPSPAAASIPAASPSAGVATPEPIGASSGGVPLLLLIVLVGAVVVGLGWRLARPGR